MYAPDVQQPFPSRSSSRPAAARTRRPITPPPSPPRSDTGGRDRFPRSASPSSPFEAASPAPSGSRLYFEGVKNKEQQRASRSRPSSSSSSTLPADLSFLDGPPPPRRSNNSSSLDLPAPSSAAGRKQSLAPRSAVANYFSIDFSFLDDEPPPEQWSRPSPYAGSSDSLEHPELPPGAGPALWSQPNAGSSIYTSSTRPSVDVPFTGGPRRESDDEERRKRLVLFLDETASAMEGGKSLAMVLPDESDQGNMTFSEMAEATTSPVTPRHEPPLFNDNPFAASNQNRYPASPHSPDSPPSPGTTSRNSFTPVTPARRRMDGAEARGEGAYRDTVYFTPKVPPSVISRSSEDEGDDEAEHSPKSRRGLGFELEVRPPSSLGQAPSERSPATLRADSPATEPWNSQSRPVSMAESVVDAEAQRLRAKLADKRRHTVEELISTEASYATDMAIVRDIYLARARGANMSDIADHVMSTGLGLGSLVGTPPTPPPSASQSAFPNLLSPSRNDQRRPTLVRRVSHQPDLQPGQPLMSVKDIQTIFANVTEVTNLAEDFAGVLANAWDESSDEDMSDQIGMVLVEMMPRIQHVFGRYCTNHNLAIERLQEITPSLTSYLDECGSLSRGRTGAWDLPSLLIKPVQRCLKYPLLIHSIIKATPDNHPDKMDLERAYTDIMMVTEHLDHASRVSDVKAKPRNDSIVARSGVKKDLYARRESTAQALTRKILGGGSSSSKKKPSTPGSELDSHDANMFEALSAAVENGKSSAARLEAEMRAYFQSTNAALSTHKVMVDGWIQMMAMTGSAQQNVQNHIATFMDSVLTPVMNGPLRDLDKTLRGSLLVKTEHLLGMFDGATGPRTRIKARNAKANEHSRYVAKRLPADRDGSEDYLNLTTKLLEELPSFLKNVKRYEDIIRKEYADAQTAYTEAVQEFWFKFSDSVESSGDQMSTMLGPLAVGLQVIPVASADSLSKRNSTSSARSARPLSTASSKRYSTDVAPNRRLSMDASAKRSSRHRPTSFASQQPSNNRASIISQEYGRGYSTNRSSLNSESSTAPSFTISTTTASSGGSPGTPPPPPSTTLKHSDKPHEHDHGHVSAGEPSSPSSASSGERGGYRQSIHSRQQNPLPPVPATDSGPHSPVTPSPKTASEHSDVDAEGEDQFEEDPGRFARPRPVIGRQRPDSRLDSQLMSTYTTNSVYADAGEGFDYDEGDPPRDILYVAQAMSAARNTTEAAGDVDADADAMFEEDLGDLPSGLRVVDEPASASTPAVPPPAPAPAAPAMPSVLYGSNFDPSAPSFVPGAGFPAAGSSVTAQNGELPPLDDDFGEAESDVSDEENGHASAGGSMVVNMQEEMPDDQPFQPTSKPTVHRKKRVAVENPDALLMCEICRGGHSPGSNRLVICESCTKGWHQICHDPVITDELVDSDIPWLCKSCDAKIAKGKEIYNVNEGQWTAGYSLEEKKEWLESLPLHTLIGYILSVEQKYGPRLSPSGLDIWPVGLPTMLERVRQARAAEAAERLKSEGDETVMESEAGSAAGSARPSPHPEAHAFRPSASQPAPPSARPPSGETHPLHQSQPYPSHYSQSQPSRPQLPPISVPPAYPSKLPGALPSISSSQNSPRQIAALPPSGAAGQQPRPSSSHSNHGPAPVPSRQNSTSSNPSMLPPYGAPRPYSPQLPPMHPEGNEYRRRSEVGLSPVLPSPGVFDGRQQHPYYPQQGGYPPVSQQPPSSSLPHHPSHSHSHSQGSSYNGSPAYPPIGAGNYASSQHHQSPNPGNYSPTLQQQQQQGGPGSGATSPSFPPYANHLPPYMSPHMSPHLSGHGHGWGGQPSPDLGGANGWGRGSNASSHGNGNGN
ncbi:Rho guanyl-nucleotide exchange factor [Pseudohyphozyma bogoriensis]|nr:Rho guanyl-nucleotide exchange factor [Pseudohyphozyma bogoriensis]